MVYLKTKEELYPNGTSFTTPYQEEPCLEFMSGGADSSHYLQSTSLFLHYNYFQEYPTLLEFLEYYLGMDYYGPATVRPTYWNNFVQAVCDLAPDHPDYDVIYGVLEDVQEWAEENFHSCGKFYLIGL